MDEYPVKGNLAVRGLGIRSDGYFHIVGKSPAMRKVYQIIEKVARGDASVAIEGESGTGKELVAQAIHLAGSRHNRPFVTLDCAAIPEGLIESQLFGHVRGAFTGAVATRCGVFAQAHRGTLFIDEIADLPLGLQVKLLRVIQSHEFTMVGGAHPQRVDVRIITATNRDLREAVLRGDFREDLYYRIAVVHLKLPPLRDRKEDIPLLVDHFLRLMTREYQKTVQGLTPEALDALLAYTWPGNVRQLQNWLEQAVVLAEGDVINVEHLPIEKVDAQAVVSTIERLSLRELERWFILETLRRTQGNQTKAAKLLGISLRGLQYKLKRYVDEGAKIDAIGTGVRRRGAGHPVAPPKFMAAGASAG